MEDRGERDADYNVLLLDGSPAAGIRLTRGANAGLAPVGMTYPRWGTSPRASVVQAREGGKLIEAVQKADGAHS